MIVRHKLLADLVRLWKNDQLIEKIDRLPVEPVSYTHLDVYKRQTVDRYSGKIRS